MRNAPIAGLLTVCLLTVSLFAKAQVVTIPVETQHNALVLQTNAQKNLKMIFWSKG